MRVDLGVVGQGVDAINGTKALYFMLLHSDQAGAATFCNDVDHNGTLLHARTCEEQVKIALGAAYDALTAQSGAASNWLWGRAHTVSAGSLYPLASSYAVGPFARAGGAFTVDVGTPLLYGDDLDFRYASGANARHISVLDAANPIVKMQLPGPERDAPASTPSALLAQYLSNSYFDMAFGSQIESLAVAKQTFTLP